MKIREGYKIRDIAGEKVVIVQGRYGADMTRIITLNETSEWLWNQLSGREFDADTVADLLTDHYEVDRPQALSDAEKWIAQLRDSGLVE